LKAPDKPSSASPAPGQSVFRARPAAPADIPSILVLERATLSAAHWPESAYHEVFAPEAPARIAILLEDESHVVCGFVIARLTSGECELENIAVAPGLQRKGVGTQLIQSLIGAARERSAHSIHLEVRDSNNAARSFYEKCGFANAGRRPKYYSGPEEDAVLCSLHL
jgi:[ribosomal protein S18]-alanine N-acetyltransferase